MEFTLLQFVAEVNQTVSEYPSDFFRCEAAFRKLLESEAVCEAVNQELSLALEQPDFRSPRLLDNGLVVHAEPGWSLIYSLYEHEPAHLYTLPFNGMIAPASAVPLAYASYDLPEDYNNAVFDRAIRLGNKRSGLAHAGDVILLDAGKTVIDIKVEVPVPAIRLYTSTFEALQWAFDRATLLAVQAIAGTERTSEMSMMVQIQGQLKNASAIPLLQRVAQTHPQHHVRWDAVKAIGNIDLVSGLEAVTAALRDPHPHLVAAAERTLRKHAETLSA